MKLMEEWILYFPLLNECPFCLQCHLENVLATVPRTLAYRRRYQNREKGMIIINERVTVTVTPWDLVSAVNLGYRGVGLGCSLSIVTLSFTCVSLC